MKIEYLVAPYLFSHKYLSLQEIGVFRLNQEISLPTEPDKEIILPENAVQFEYNPRAIQDETFIAYIMEQTRKIKPLATSDLESFTMLGKQFMNIGKPLILEGLGMLIKNQSGQYEFKQGTSFHNFIDTQAPVSKERESAEISFSSPARKQGNKNWLAAVLVIVIASALGLLFYTLRNKKNDQKEQPVVTQQDTTPALRDSNPAMSQTALPDTSKQALSTTDSFTFKIVIREYDNQALADKKMDQFKTYGHKLVQVKKDSTHIFLAMPFMKPLSDTIRMRDSLKVLFGGTPVVLTP